MPSINITTKQFTEVFVAYLVDNLVDGPAPNTEEWSEFIGTLRSKNVHTDAYKFYMDMDPQSRQLYKIIKKIFHNGSSDNVVINIRPINEPEPESKKDVLKKVIKKAMKLIKSERQRRGMPLSEGTIEKIIDHVVTEETKGEDNS